MTCHASAYCWWVWVDVFSLDNSVRSHRMHSTQVYLAPVSLWLCSHTSIRLWTSFIPLYKVSPCSTCVCMGAFMFAYVFVRVAGWCRGMSLNNVGFSLWCVCACVCVCVCACVCSRTCVTSTVCEVERHPDSECTLTWLKSEFDWPVYICIHAVECSAHVCTYVYVFVRVYCVWVS